MLGIVINPLVCCFDNEPGNNSAPNTYRYLDNYCDSTPIQGMCRTLCQQTFISYGR